MKYSWIGEEMAKIRRDFLPEDLRPILEKNGVSGTILVQADQSEAETKFLLQQGDEHSFVKGVVGWIDLSGQDVSGRLSYYAQHPLFKGVRHTVWDEEGEFMLDSRFQRGISALENLGLTYDLLVFDYQLSGAIQLVERFPEQRFVLDHMGKPQIRPDGPSMQWEQLIRELATKKNVYCKLSGMFTETPNLKWEYSHFPPYLDVVTEAFGPERLMFGSDWPVSLSAATYQDVLFLIRNYFSSFSEVDVRKIMGENAVRFYNLDL